MGNSLEAISAGAYNVFTLLYFLWQASRKIGGLVYRVFINKLDTNTEKQKILGLQSQTDLVLSFTCRELAYK